MDGQQEDDWRATPRWTCGERWVVIAVLAQAVVPVGRLLWGKSAVVDPLWDAGFAACCVVGAAVIAWSAERRVRRVRRAIEAGRTGPPLTS